MPNWRLRLLCEDRRTERFIRRLCEHYGHRRMDVDLAPSGRGSASEWVKQHYAEALRKTRSKNFQKHLGLLVVVDGDQVGFEARVKELAKKLEDEAVAPLTDDDPVALMIPSWSIETWLAYLASSESVEETKSLKLEPSLRALWDNGQKEAKTIRNAVEAWRKKPAEDAPPSLRHGYRQVERFEM